MRLLDNLGAGRHLRPEEKGKKRKKKNAPAHIVGGGTPIMHSETQIFRGGGHFSYIDCGHTF